MNKLFNITKNRALALDHLQYVSALCDTVTLDKFDKTLWQV